PVVIETAQELERAVNSKTALMYFLNESQDNGKIMHEEWLALAKKHNIPTIIDIAADIPPVENLWKFNDMGFDLVCISGGKALKGPQSAGLLLGKKPLIAAARLNGPPGGGNIGRGMKVNKEEILGMYAALDKYVNQDHDAEWKMWEDRVAVITGAAKSVNGVTTEVTVPPVANHTPRITISWDQSKVKATPREIMQGLRNGNPCIEVMGGGNAISITVFVLNPGEDKTVAKRIQEELAKVAV